MRGFGYFSPARGQGKNTPSLPAYLRGKYGRLACAIARRAIRAAARLCSPCLACLRQARQVRAYAALFATVEFPRRSDRVSANL